MTSYLICKCNLLFLLKRALCFFPSFFPCHYIHTNLPLSSSLHNKHSSLGNVQFLLFFGLRSFFFVWGDFVFVFAIINRASTTIVRQVFSNIYSSPYDRWVNWDFKKLNNYLIHSSIKCGSKLFLQLIMQYLLAKEPKQLQIYPLQSSL